MESGLTWARRRKGYGPCVMPWGGLVTEGEDVIMPESEIRDRPDWEVAGEHIQDESVAPPVLSTAPARRTKENQVTPDGVVEDKHPTEAEINGSDSPNADH